MAGDGQAAVRMRVAVVAPEIGSGRGGDETLMRGLLAGLSLAAGPTDEFYVLLNSGSEPPPALSPPQFTIDRIPETGGLQRYALTTPRILRHARTKLDLVFSVTHAPVLSRLPRVLLINDLSFVRHPEHYPLLDRLRLTTIVPRQARASHVVATVSEFSKRDLIQRYGLPEERVFVVPCAVKPPPQVDLDPEAELAACGVDQPFILYLGNLHPRKNVARLIDAFAEGRQYSAPLRDHRLVIAGARWWGQGVEEQAAERAPAGSVVFLGRVSDSVKEALLRTATVLAFPSLFEGFGLPPLEAMARGTPVLTSRVASLPETAGDAALFIDPTDTSDIAAGLVRLAADTALREELRNRGLAQANRFTATNTGHRLMAALHAALEFDGPIGRA